MARWKTPYAAVPDQGATHSGSRLFSVLRLVALTLFCAATAAAGWVAHFARTPIEVPPSARQLTVEQGLTFKGIARQLVGQGILQ